MIVTTAGRTNKIMIDRANDVSKQLDAKRIRRNKQSVREMQAVHQDDVLVVGKDKLVIHPLHSDEPIFFHPNSAAFRLKRVWNGEKDPFLEAADLSPGMMVLDATLGLASDAIMASDAVGDDGVIIGLESNRYLAYLAKNGLKEWNPPSVQMKEAMERIQVIHAANQDFLKQCGNDEFDVVYFDPMFEETVLDSDGIKGIKGFADYSPLTFETIEEAKRVASHRVILKDHWKSSRFAEFGFTQLKRKTATFHFGYLES